MTRLGLGASYRHILTVRGRKTGRLYSIPVDVVELGGQRWLVAPYRPVNWVHNARASGETATFTVTNTGSHAGTDIVPIYLSRPVSTVVVPPQRLVGFARVALAAAESRVVRVSIPASTLAETPGDISASGPPNGKPGAYLVQLDKDDTRPYDVALSAPFTVS